MNRLWARALGSLWTRALPRKGSPQLHLGNCELPDEHDSPDREHGEPSRSLSCRTMSGIRTVSPTGAQVGQALMLRRILIQTSLQQSTGTRSHSTPALNTA